MRSIYIADRFRGPDGFAVHLNVVRVEQLMHELIRRALEQSTPVAVLCPHSMTVHFDRTFTDDYWLEATLEHMRRCDAVLMGPTWKESEGATAERNNALADGQPVFHTVDDALLWLREQAANDADDRRSTPNRPRPSAPRPMPTKPPGWFPRKD